MIPLADEVRSECHIVRDLWWRGSTGTGTGVNPFTADPVKALTLPYWSNPPFLIFDIRALWRSGLSARAPECQKLKKRWVRPVRR